MGQNKLLSMLGICRKAGQLTMGMDVVLEGIAKDKIFTVLLTQDLSRRSNEKITAAAVHKSVRIITAPLGMDEIAALTGKASGIIGITDKGLADAVESIICRMKEEGIAL
ncbi:MAG: ribosomal L7Ae/L30e/S12e/Gadd45 family protein [Oscillospiraceae bacterium]|nr:ribosomal L7Ae/L30e/S12e/Gadd45 family protein [Oscillospiraceae bacterium]